MHKRKLLSTSLLTGAVLAILVSVLPSRASAAYNPTAIDLINDTRATLGLRRMPVDSRLTSSAQAKCADMVKYNYWSHNNPNGTTWHSFIEARVNYKYMGEVLGKGYGRDWAAQHEDWMNSPTHRSVITGNYTRIGSYSCKYRSGNILTVVHFGRQLQ